MEGKKSDINKMPRVSVECEMNELAEKKIFVCICVFPTERQKKIKQVYLENCTTLYK